MGYGEKMDFMNLKYTCNGPASNVYNPGVTSSIEYLNDKCYKAPNLQNGFRNTFDKYEKICYKGME